MNVYPSQYQLPEVTAYVIALLERRRVASEEWTEALEGQLRDEAVRALAEAGVQFREMADDPPYWERVTERVLKVALPRYYRAAQDQHALERRQYGIWRGGDFVARAAFALAGLVMGVVIWRTGIPKYFEPLPLALFIGGPLIPDAQVWFAKRRYTKALAAVVEDMRLEATDTQTYQPLGLEEPRREDDSVDVASSRPPEKTR